MRGKALFFCILFSACSNQTDYSNARVDQVKIDENGEHLEPLKPSASNSSGDATGDAAKKQATQPDEKKATEQLANNVPQEQTKEDLQNNIVEEPQPFTGPIATVTAMPMQSLKLLSDQALSIPIKAGPNFSGTLKLSLEKEELDELDPEGNITFTVTPATMQMQKGETKNATIQIKVGAGTPAMPQAQHFHLIVESMEADKQGLINSEVEFQVLPAADIQMMGGPVTGQAGEVWSSPMAEKLTFKQAVTLNFINMSEEKHIVHGSGDIDHQDTGDNFVKGQVYSVQLNPGQTGRFYCHEHETGRFAHEVEFLAP